MVMLVGTLSTFAANEVTTTIIDGYMYQLFDDNTARLLPNYFNLDVVIPSTVTYSNKSYTVTAIDEEAFKNRTQVTSVSIPNTVTTIGNYAFSGCTALTSISLPSSVTKIGSYAFKDCSSLTSVVLTASNEQITIASNVFEGCSNEVYNSYDNALYIGTGANPYLYLMKATSTDITSCQIHPNCKYINDYAFEGCDNLTEIPISNTITYIGKYVFHGCTGLTSITIPGSVTAIGDCAFDGCSALASLTLNSGVTTIGSCAFRGCSSLTTVTVPRSVISIGSTAFGGCSALESITLPFVGRAALAVDDYSQYHYPFGCIFGTTSYEGGTATEQDVYTSQSDHYDLTYYIPSSLKTVTIDAADNDVAILEGAFYNCTKLTSVSLNQVTSIEARAFWNCTSLTTITIPQSVTSIARGVFDGCMALETMTLPFPGTQKYTPAMVETEISENPDGDNYGFYFKSIFVQRYSYSYYSSLRTVNITNCEYLPYNTFSDCNKITSITLPDNLTTIGEKAFYNCTNLTSTTIPSNVTTVGENAYQYCNSIASIITESTADLSAANLRFSKDGFNYRVLNKSTVELTGSSNTTGTVTIPATVTCGNTFTVISIASKAFWNFTDVSSVSVPETVSTIGDNAFYHVPLLQYSGTAEGSPWGAEIRIIIDGDFAYYDAEKTQLVAYFGTGGDVVVPNTVTEIYSTTFKNCVGLTSVTIPSSVTSINGSAFSGCTNLTKVTLNNNTIASKTYTSSSNFKTIFGSQVEEFVLGEGVTSIGESAFNGCTGLTSVTIPSSVSTMGNYAFSGCTGLTSLIIPEGVTSIGNYAFSGCTGLTSITIPERVTSIGNEVFSGCTGLTSITIPEGVTEIGFRAFHSCTGLTSITIPERVTSIDNEAFIGWSNAQEFVFEGETPPSFGTSVFYGSSCPIYVPTKDAITAYKAATNMSNYASRIQVKPYEVDGVKYQIQEDGTFAVVASNYSGDVVIRSSVDYNGVATAVTSIADNAFKDCIDLTAVTIPSNVTSVGGSAFGGCTNLTKVTINSNAVA
ncbi:MAG: leucine-rich repeat protein, partial [Bacteroidales bacterium]|nr:leucine-rich repeat protein [Bacteroidales bacterium]